MILVAATAAGLAVGREWGKLRAFEFVSAPGPPILPFDLMTGKSARSFDLVRFLYRASLPFLWTLPLAFLIIRLLPPRPRFRRLVRQPGMAACCSAILAMIFVASRTLILSAGVRAAFNRGYAASWWALEVTAPEIAMMVGGAWFILAMGGWWRPERSWVDRLGIALAFGWLSVAFLASFCPLLLP